MSEIRIKDFKSLVSFSGNYNDLSNKPTIPVVSDDAYDAISWDGNTNVPTKNAIRDKIETLSGGGLTKAQALGVALL